ncbi:MAG TPA: methyltransferase domain-containing protein [Pirellulales bacterium]|jgi:trans-aconitate 2-methyltransferase
MTRDSSHRPAPAQTWNAALYDRSHSFVYKAAADMLELLNPQPGEQIIDLGCGTGHLTAMIADRGARVLGLDQSAEMIAAARKQFPKLAFELADATSFTVPEPQDAIFSNAVLHWVHPPGAAVEAISRALRPGGRFVTEFGGKGCMARTIAALNTALGEPDLGRRPWFFPSIAEYAPLLEEHGFEVRFATLFDRPTPLEEGKHGLRNWLTMFGEYYLARLDAAERERIFQEVEKGLHDELWREDRWVADYRRIRLVAVKL